METRFPELENQLGGMADPRSQTDPTFRTTQLYRKLTGKEARRRLNADNGPENSGSRTQWLRRLAESSVAHQVIVQLACYPPYHSKYNPVERVFGVLENYWNGDPLLSIDDALGMASAMTYKGVSPQTSLHPGGSKGTRLAAKAMKVLEQGMERLEGLRKWFVKIMPDQAERALKRLAELKL